MKATAQQREDGMYIVIDNPHSKRRIVDFEVFDSLNPARFTDDTTLKDGDPCDTDDYYEVEQWFYEWGKTWVNSTDNENLFMAPTRTILRPRSAVKDKPEAEGESDLNESMKILASIKYKAWGHEMVGIFHSGTSGAPINYNKWFIYFRNAEDGRLKELSSMYFTEPMDCVRNAILKLTELEYLPNPPQTTKR